MFGEDFLRFLEPASDRLVRLTGMLAARGLQASVLSAAGRRHILVRAGEGVPLRMIVAHYDRVQGSPGALDNSAACLALANFGSRLSRQAQEVRGAIILLFTDGEEAPARSGPLAQGAYALGLGLKRTLGGVIPSILVLDVVGRGSRILLSSAPGDMLRRTGEGKGEVARRIPALEEQLKKAARRAGLGEALLLPLPWSDDLGFVLAGLPAIAATLLPEDEAEAYRQRLEALGLEAAWFKDAHAEAAGHAAKRVNTPFNKGFIEAGSFGQAWPPTWNLLHGPGDSVDTLEEKAISAIEGFCQAFCSEGDSSD